MDNDKPILTKQVYELITSKISEVINSLVDKNNSLCTFRNIISFIFNEDSTGLLDSLRTSSKYPYEYIRPYLTLIKENSDDLICNFHMLVYEKEDISTLQKDIRDLLCNGLTGYYEFDYEDLITDFKNIFDINNDKHLEILKQFLNAEFETFKKNLNLDIKDYCEIVSIYNNKIEDCNDRIKQLKSEITKCEITLKDYNIKLTYAKSMLPENKEEE